MQKSVLLAGLALLTLGGCESAQQAVSDKEDHLLAAGFVDQPANTPGRHAALLQLPAHRFLRRVHGQSVHYVYADPTVCNCLYVGSQQAYGNYQNYRQSQALADEQQETAMDYQNPGWNWGPWGGGFGPGFGGGFGSGFGWGPGLGW